MTASLNARKINTAVERMSDCVYSLEINMKEHITENNFFFEINMPLQKKLLKRWMTARSPVKVNTLFL